MEQEIFRIGSAKTLVDWLHDISKPYIWLANQLDPPVTRSAISLWSSRTSRPCAAHRDQVELISGGRVKARDWLPSAAELSTAESLLLQTSETLDRLGIITHYVVIGSRGNILRDFTDVIDAKGYLDNNDGATKLQRRDDGVVLSRKVARDRVTEAYVMRQIEKE